MTAGQNTRRGGPLLLLGLLLVGWAAMRSATWQFPLDLDRAPAALAASPLLESVQRAGAVLTGSDGANSPLTGNDVATTASIDCGPDGCARGDLRRSVRSLAGGAAPASLILPGAGPIQQAARLLKEETGVAPPSYEAGSQTALPAPWVYSEGDTGAALQRQPGTPAAARQTQAPLGVETAGTKQRRWTGDAWLLLREDNAAPLLASQPSYGRSQAGAVLRYLLAPSSGHAPQAYVRASGALEAPRDVELAGGLSARPIAGLPVRVAAELRAADTNGGTDLRPAAYAVTELPPQDLPLGTRGEVYAQAGYVGGDFATAFIDGQARVLRDLAQLGRSRIAAGAGAWGGAQKGASRLDVGPSALVSFRLGEVNARVAIDYRIRVAGSAKPRSGPALTLAAGF